MRFATEAPLSELNYTQRYTDFDFILSHLVLECDEYRAHYANSQRFKMLDNSYFELGHSLSAREIEEALDLVHPDEVIAPDTFKDAIKFCLSNYTPLKEQGCEIAVVVHGNTLQEKAAQLEIFSQMIQVKTICIPFDLTFFPKDRYSEVTNWQCSRLLLLRGIQEKKLHHKKRYHLLGCSSPMEFKLVNQFFPWVDSFDTSAPIVAALQKKSITRVDKKLHRPENYFELDFTPEERRRVRHNFKVLKLWVGNHK